MNNYNSHNPYFNRWFSAIMYIVITLFIYICHNPYFNRWFSAIQCYKKIKKKFMMLVTILILIDGFLQCDKK